MSTETFPMKVLMLPWLAYGHILPLLELAKKLSRRNTHTHLCSTPVSLASIKNKIPQNYSKSIHLVELHLPSLPELPPHYHTTNGLPLHLNPTLTKALGSSKESFSRILETLKPDLLIHDLLVEWAPAVSMNVPAVAFLPTRAVMGSYLLHFMKNPDGIEYPFPAIKFTGFEQDMVNGFVESIIKRRTQGKSNSFNGQWQIALISSSKAMDGEYIVHLSELLRKKIVPVGQLVWADDDHGDNNDTENQETVK